MKQKPDESIFRDGQNLTTAELESIRDELLKELEGSEQRFDDEVKRANMEYEMRERKRR